MSENKIPFLFPNQPKLTGHGIHVLAGDVGGTKTNLALFHASSNKIEMMHEGYYHSSNYSSGVDIVNQFLTEHPQSKPDRIALGVAGPVMDGKVELTNLSWNLDVQDLRNATSVKNAFLLNDLEATAYGLAALRDDDFITVHPGVNEQGNIAIVAPGTGLGEAGLFWDGQYYRPFATEGGHTDFSPRTELDIELSQFLQKKYEIVSWERIIAGPAIFDIYEFLCEVKNKTKADWLVDAFTREDPSAVISESALEEKDPVCIETMQMFVRYLARESSNLVLKMKAVGGLFLGGGIPPKITSLLQQNIFYNNFLDCDRMQHLMKKVPVKIILNNKAALLGAAYFGAYAE